MGGLCAEDGTFVSAARFIDVDLSAAADLPSGLGARHAAALSISRDANCVAVAVSESSIVRAFAEGLLRAEITPEVFGGGTRASFANGDAEVHELPDVGLTIAVAR